MAFLQEDKIYKGTRQLSWREEVCETGESGEGCEETSTSTRLERLT